MSVPGGTIDFSKLPGAIPGVELPEKELTEFKIWIERNPQFKGRNPLDQIALFRDAQVQRPRNQTGGPPDQGMPDSSTDSKDA